MPYVHLFFAAVKNIARKHRAYYCIFIIERTIYTGGKEDYDAKK